MVPGGRRFERSSSSRRTRRSPGPWDGVWLFVCLFVSWPPSPCRRFSPTLLHRLVALGSPPATSAPGWTGLARPTSAPGLGPPLPHLRRDWAHPAHLCTGTGLTPPTTAPGQGSPRPPRRERRRPIAALRWVCLFALCAAAQAARVSPSLLICGRSVKPAEGMPLRVSGLGARPQGAWST